MVNKEVLTARIEQIDKHLNKLSGYCNLSYNQFLTDSVAQDVVEYNTFQMINHIIDMAEHIVVDENYGFPATAYEAIQTLFFQKIFDDKDLATLKKMISFRNIIGHDYIDINKKIVFSVLTEGTNDIKRITSKIVKKFL